MTCGIYSIKNKKTGQMYIGLSKNIEKRWKQHCEKCEQSIKIDRIINEEGKSNFDLTIIEKLPPINELLSNREKYWIKHFNTFENDFHYNNSPGGQYSIKPRKKHATIIRKGHNREKQRYGISYQGEEFFCTESKQALENILETFFDEDLVLLENYTIKDLKREGRKLLISYTMPRKKHATIIKAGYNKGRQQYAIYYQGQQFLNTISKQILENILKTFFDENLILLQNYTIEDVKRKGKELFIKNNKSLWGKLDEVGGIEFLKEEKNMGKTQKSIAKKLGFSRRVIYDYLRDQDLSWEVL